MILSNYNGLTLIGYPFNIIIIFSFILTFVFVTLNYIGKFNKFISKSYITILPIFFFIVYTSIVFTFILIDVTFAKNFVVYTYFALLIVTIFNFSKFKFFYIKNYNFFLEKIKKKNKLEIFILYSFIILYFLVSILPISDADSLNYHSGFASTAIKNRNLDFLKDVELIDFNFFFIGYGEIFNFIGLSLGLDNFGSVLNFLSIIIIFLYLLKNYTTNVLLVSISIISSPILISLISSQKNYLLPISLLSILFLNIYKLNLNKKDLFFFLTISFFAIASKTSLVPFAILLIIILSYIAYKNKYFKNFIYNFIISFLIILTPFLFKNIFYHSDIFPPFTAELLNYNSKEASEFTNWIRGYDVTISIKNLFYLPILFIIPHFTESGKLLFSFSQITKIFGIQFYNFLFVRRADNNYIILLICISILILLTKNISTRWFLLIFILLQFSILEFRLINNNFLKKIIYLQSFFVFAIILSFTIFSIYLISTGSKEKFYEKFSYGYSFSRILNNFVTEYNLKEHEYILYSHRSHFWNDSKNNVINLGNDYNELYNFSNNKVSFNKKIIEKISDKKIKMIIFKEHFNDISIFNLKNDCTYNYIEFKDNRQTRNLFLYGKKNYSYIYFENGDLIKCFGL